MKPLPLGELCVEYLRESHDISFFSCSNEDLNDFLKSDAKKSQGDLISRTCSMPMATLDQLPIDAGWLDPMRSAFLGTHRATAGLRTTARGQCDGCPLARTRAGPPSSLLWTEAVLQLRTMQTIKFISWSTKR